MPIVNKHFSTQWYKSPVLAYLLSFWSNGVDFVDEEDGGLVLLALAEGLAKVRFRFAGHLRHDLGTVEEEEECASLIGNCSSDRRFSCARRSVEQNSARRFDADRLEETRMAKWQLHHLLDLKRNIALSCANLNS